MKEKEKKEEHGEMTVSKDAGAAMHDGRVGWRRGSTYITFSLYLFYQHF